MPLSRRRVLQLSLGSAAALWMGSHASRGWLGKRESALAEDAVTRRAWALGSDVSMTVMGLPRGHAEQALNAAFAELELVEQVMSLYRPDSQLCRLNRDRVLDQPHPYLIEVLTVAAATSQRSNGAFDITVQPLWELFAACQNKIDCRPIPRSPMPAPASIGERSRSPRIAFACEHPRPRSRSTGSLMASRLIGQSLRCVITASNMRW